MTCRVPRGILRLTHEGEVKYLRCVECGLRGGGFALVQCKHRRTFAVHAARICLRKFREVSIVTVEQRRIEEWMNTNRQDEYVYTEYAPPNCETCGVFQFVDEKPKHKEASMATAANATYGLKDESNESFWFRLGERMKEEGGMASLRMGARQFMLTAKVPVIRALRKRGIRNGGIESLLQTALGEGAFSIGLGLLLPHVPGFNGNATALISKELRIQGMSAIGSEFADVLLEPLRQSMLAAFGEDVQKDK